MEEVTTSSALNSDTLDYSFLLNCLKGLRDKYQLTKMGLFNKRLPKGERDRLKREQDSIELQINNLKITYKDAPLPNREVYAEHQDIPEFIEAWIKAIELPQN